MRILGLCLATLAVIALACDGDDDPTQTVTPTVGATATATATATQEPTSPPATATPDPVAPTATPGAAGAEYGVVKVHRNDPDGGLNLRAEASGSAPILAVIPPNATAVQATGESTEHDATTWLEVIYDGTIGWADATFLSPLPSFDEISCGDPASDYTLSPGAVPPVPAPVDSDADHVFAVHHSVGPDCERTVITFGRDFSFEADFDLLLEAAEGVPADIALALDLATIRVALPDPVTAAASTATESLRSDNGGADLLFVRPGPASRFGVFAAWDRNRGVRHFYLENPGRLVIDTIEAPTGGGLALGAIVGDNPTALTVVSRAINWDTNGLAPEPPVTVTGFARPFEAVTVVRLRTEPASGAPAGSGDPVTANWSGSTFAAACGSTYAVMTTDYLEAWGQFSFTIEALAPGSYELFVGEDSPADGTEGGVYHVFTVGGSTAASC